MWGDTQVLKLFAAERDVAAIETEARVSQVMHESGIPTPGTHGVVEVEGWHGIVYDRVFGTSMMGQLSAKPWKLFAFGRKLAELQASVHQFRIDQLPSQHEQLAIRSAVNIYRRAARRRATPRIPYRKFQTRRPNSSCGLESRAKTAKPKLRAESSDSAGLGVETVWPCIVPLSSAYRSFEFTGWKPMLPRTRPTSMIR